MLEPTVTPVRRNLVFNWQEGPLVKVTRIREERGEIHGEVAVGLRQQGEVLHIHEAHLNMSATRSRDTFAHRLVIENGPSLLEWKEIMEIVCVRSIRRFRQGRPSVWIDEIPFRDSIASRLEPFLFQRQPTVIFGDGGAGKTTFALALAISIATGERFLSYAPTPTPVFYLDWEADEETIARRVDRLKRGMDIRGHIPLRYKRMYGLLSEQLDEIASEVTEEGYGVVIVDAMGKATANAPEGAAAALTLFDGMDSIEVDYLIIDHMDKVSAANGTRNPRPYGSTYKYNSARSVWYAKGQGEPGENEIYVKMENIKGNDLTKAKPVPLKITFEDDRTVIERTAWAEMPEAVRGGPTRVERIQGALENGPKTVKEIAKALKDKEESVRTELNRMLSKELVEKLDAHNWRVIQ